MVTKTCAVCLGHYEDNLTDDVLQKKWVRYTNTENCGVLMHSDCLQTEGNSYVCNVYGVIFKFCLTITVLLQEFFFGFV